VLGGNAGALDSADFAPDRASILTARTDGRQPRPAGLGETPPRL